jgi:hypothetical protein
LTAVNVRSVAPPETGRRSASSSFRDARRYPEIVLVDDDMTHDLHPMGRRLGEDRRIERARRA